MNLYRIYVESSPQGPQGIRGAQGAEGPYGPDVSVVLSDFVFEVVRFFLLLLTVTVTVDLLQNNNVRFCLVCRSLSVCHYIREW